MKAQGMRLFLQRYPEALTIDFEAGLDKYVVDDSLKEHAHFFRTVFPGYSIEPIETIAEDNKISAYAIFRGTHRDPM
jgi:hypothetical protein